MRNKIVAILASLLIAVEIFNTAKSIYHKSDDEPNLISYNILYSIDPEPKKS